MMFSRLTAPPPGRDSIISHLKKKGWMSSVVLRHSGVIFWTNPHPNLINLDNVFNDKCTMYHLRFRLNGKSLLLNVIHVQNNHDSCLPNRLAPSENSIAISYGIDHNIFNNNLADHLKKKRCSNNFLNRIINFYKTTLADPETAKIFENIRNDHDNDEQDWPGDDGYVCRILLRAPFILKSCNLCTFQ